MANVRCQKFKALFPRKARRFPPGLAKIRATLGRGRRALDAVPPTDPLVGLPLLPYE